MRYLITSLLLLTASASLAKKTLVTNEQELTVAVAKATAGDTIVLQNGTWNNISLILNCSGNKDKPVVIQAQTEGKAILSGVSQLKFGGEHIIVNGLFFTNGYAPGEAVIQFRTDNKHIANDCRLMHCVINDFNKPERYSEDYWIALSGKNNRIDHCTFLNKKNLGVLMAVLLDDDRSRENNHSIDHNYFGARLPLGSNAGEIIRVGVSQHCQYDSKTKITDNFFEHCDGEVEIISIKSGSNIVRNNVFKECQGDVVLRHGNYNTIQNNLFIGNDKEGTGGVRIINKGQWVVNNLFYKCRGVDFRSPLSIMNGVPNSPANRYVQVTDAVVANNSFYNCSPISFCEGSDAERSMPPDNVLFANNVFYNNKDSLIYHVYDNIKGIRFQNNVVSKDIDQRLAQGFKKASLLSNESAGIKWSVANENETLPDSIISQSKDRLNERLPAMAGFTNAALIKSLVQNASENCGAKWFHSVNPEKQVVRINCKSANEIYTAVATNKNKQLIINLTSGLYEFTEPIELFSVTITAPSIVRFSSTQFLPYLFLIKNGSAVRFEKIDLDLSGLKAANFISSDSNTSSNRFSLQMDKAGIQNFKGTAFFNAVRSSFADSIYFTNCRFANNQAILFNFANEQDKKGYYNVEKLVIRNNKLTAQKGTVLQMLRGGNDESTMGPRVMFVNNLLTHCTSDNALISFFGTQYSYLENNVMTDCNSMKTLLRYEDVVRARHFIKGNQFKNSGSIEKNKFVIE